MSRKYNLLTQRLLAEGYTADHYPDYVRLPSGSCYGEEPLQNLNDGFEYTPRYLNKLVFKTGCGLLLKGSHFGFGGAWFAGISWIPENDNPLVTCPYRKDTCDSRNPLLSGPSGGGICKILQCDCHQTEEAYDYERSFDRVHDEKAAERNRKYKEFVKSKNGHVCHWHMNYNDWTEKWIQSYDPMTCARHCMNVGGVCDLTHQPISRKKGNVFYDVKISYIRKDGTLFDGEEVVRVNKGVRLFETNKSMTICEEAAKRCVQNIVDKERQKRHAEILINGWRVEVQNIRAEQRESRDLMQDLRDIKDGIQVIHASDLKKREDANKREKREKAKKKKIEKLERTLLEIGYYNLPEHSLDKIHADRWLSEDRIEEIEEMRARRLEEEIDKPIQLSLFDMIKDQL